MVANAAVRFTLSLLEMKASVLRKAKLEVIEVEAVDPPWGEPEGGWYRFHLLVTPSQAPDGLLKWEPTELNLIPATSAKGKQLSVQQVEDSLPPHSVQLLQWDRDLNGDKDDGGSRTFRSAAIPENAPDKIVGPGEVEILIRLARGQSKMRLHYYHILIGKPIDLP